MPCELDREEENPYSPLWGVQATTVPAGSILSLLDTTSDQNVSDITSADLLFEAVDSGDLLEPEPQTEDSTGNPVPGNDGQIFFNCPNPVADTFVPYPCSAND